MSASEVVRAAFQAYLDQDLESERALLADDFTFTSPQDDHIDRAAFLDRCFPTAGRLRSQHILELVDAGDSAAFILYEYELLTGERHRNTEFIKVRDGQLVETQVFFGAQLA